MGEADMIRAADMRPLLLSGLGRIKMPETAINPRVLDICAQF